MIISPTYVWTAKDKRSSADSNTHTADRGTSDQYDEYEWVLPQGKQKKQSLRRHRAVRPYSPRRGRCHHPTITHGAQGIVFRWIPIERFAT